MKKRLDKKDKLTEWLTLSLVLGALLVIFLKVLFL